MIAVSIYESFEIYLFIYHVSSSGFMSNNNSKMGTTPNDSLILDIALEPRSFSYIQMGEQQIASTKIHGINYIG